MALLHNRFVEINPPCPVYFAGWRSDTHQLGHNGWEIALSDNHYRFTRDMVLYHPPSGLKLMASSRDAGPHNFYASHDAYRQHRPEFTVTSASGKTFIRHEAHIPPLASFGWVDTEPKYVAVDTDMELTPLFQKRNAPVAEQLIVYPSDVSAMLEQIKKMQSPEQAAIRARNRTRDYMENEARPLVHATILSFPKAA